MFYSTDILTKKRGGMGVVWLAATLGTHHRRLTKRDYVNVNVVEACDFLVAPPEPLALRLSSNLMVGVTRVYRQQYIFYFNDVNHVFTNLRQHLVAGPRLEVEMEQPEQRHDAITLPEASDSLAQEWNFLSQRNMNHDLMVQFGWIADENHPDLTCVPAASDALSINTSLYSHHERALMNAADKTLLSVSDNSIISAKRSTVGSLIFPAHSDHSSVTGSSFHGGIGSQVGFSNIDAQGGNDDLFGEDFGRILNDVRLDHQRAGGGSVLGSETSFAFQGFNNDDGSNQFGSTDTPSLVGHQQKVKEVAQRAGVKRRRKEPVAQADERIEFHANALFVLHGDMAINEHYLALSSDQDHEKPDVVRQEIRALIGNPLADMCDANFNAWFDWNPVKIDIGQLDVSFKVEKKRRRVENQNEHQDHIDEMAPEMGMAFEADISFDSIAGNMEHNSNEFALPDELEVGRDAQTPRAQRPSLPWKNPAYSSSTLHSEVSEFGFGAATNKRRKSSMRDSNRLSMGPETLGIGDWNEYGELATEQEGGRLSTNVYSEQNPFTQTLEKDTMGFYNYLNELMDKESEEQLDFDRVLEERSGKIAAADAFYRVLVLATRDMLKVHQDKPYGKIELEVY